MFFGGVFLSLLLTSIISACSHQSFQLEPSYIRPWTKLAQNENVSRYPQLALYRKHGKQLLYLASEHSTKYNSPTFQLIRDTLSKHTVDILVLEGFPRSRGLSPVLKNSRSCAPAWGCPGGESQYLVEMAHTRGWPFVGGEPDEGDILRAVERGGFSAEDLVCFYFVRQVPQYRRAGDSRKGHELFEVFTTALFKQALFDRVTRPSWERFREWFKSKAGTDFSLDGVSSETVAPYADGTFMNRLSAIVGETRDRHIISVLSEVLQTHESVLAVYGGSHWYTQAPALEDRFGPPKHLESSR